MSRLPIPGSDAGNWGDVLNDFLSQEHNADGTLKRKNDIDRAQTDIAALKAQSNNLQANKADIDHSLPVGGTTGQMLVKASNTDYDTEWSPSASASAIDAVTPKTTGGVIVGGASGPSEHQGVTYDTTVEQGHKVTYNGTNWVTRRETFVDIRDFAVDPTGNSDSSAAINLALKQAAAAKVDRVDLGAPPTNAQAVYSITSPINIPEGGWLTGGATQGWPTVVQYVGTSLTDNAIQHDPLSNQSGMRIDRLQVIDKRTDPARTGVGISTDGVRNYIYIADCNVQNFYDNYLVGMTTAGNTGDCFRLERNWSIGFLRYGLNIMRTTNDVSIQSFWGDTAVGAPGQALINIANAGGALVIQDVKHENSNGSHTIWQQAGNGTQLFVSGVYSWAPGRPAGSGGDVVRLQTDTGGGVTLASIGSDGNGPTSLLNVVALGYTVATADRILPFWTGSVSVNDPKPRGIRVGGNQISHRQGAPQPEGVVLGRRGDLILTPSGTHAYLKTIGDATNTGWRSLQYYDATAPTISAGGGAGTSPAVSVSGDQRAGTITVTTGTSPLGGATVATITYATAFPFNAGVVTLSPVEANAAALAGTATVYVDSSQNTTTKFAIKVGSTPLAASTTYKWAYHIDGA